MMAKTGASYARMPALPAARQANLFPEVDAGPITGVEHGWGCVAPIGWRRSGHGRRGQTRQRMNTLALFTELRGLISGQMDQQLGGGVDGVLAALSHW